MARSGASDAAARAEIDDLAVSLATTKAELEHLRHTSSMATLVGHASHSVLEYAVAEAEAAGDERTVAAATVAATALQTAGEGKVDAHILRQELAGLELGLDSVCLDLISAQRLASYAIGSNLRLRIPWAPQERLPSPQSPPTLA